MVGANPVPGIARAVGRRLTVRSVAARGERCPWINVQHGKLEHLCQWPHREKKEKKGKKEKGFFCHLSIELPPKSKCGSILAKVAVSRIYNAKYRRRRTFSVTISHSPITLVNLSCINLVSIFTCSRCSSSSPLHNPVYPSRVDPSVLDFSLSSHRHSYISLLFSSHFID